MQLRSGYLPQVIETRRSREKGIGEKGREGKVKSKKKYIVRRTKSTILESRQGVGGGRRSRGKGTLDARKRGRYRITVEKQRGTEGKRDVAM